MANYRIATEKEAASVGGGTSYTENLAVTKIRAVALGCQIRLTSYTDNQLVALKDLYKTESQACSSTCSCNQKNAGCSGECYTQDSCSCNNVCTNDCSVNYG